MSVPASGLHDVSLKIGELLANVEGLKESQEASARQIARFDSKLDGVSGDVRQLKNDMNDLKPSVKRYDRDRNRILGGVSVISAILGAAGGFILDYIRKVFSV